jgi:hypothetical protein
LLAGIVTQVSSQWQRSVSQLWYALDALLHSSTLKRATHTLERSKAWLLCVVIVLLLLIWHWQLVVSAAMGLGVLLAVYLLHQRQWQVPSLWRELWHPAQRSLTLAIFSGLIATGSTYLSLALWQETAGWVAISMILQGMGTLAVLLLLSWQAIERLTTSTNRTERTGHLSDRLLNDLSDVDALKRLIAVRRLTQALHQPSTADCAATLLSTAHLAECFRLMLNRETDPAVCRALLDSLQQLSQGQPQPRSLPPHQSMPLSAVQPLMSRSPQQTK